MSMRDEYAEDPFNATVTRVAASDHEIELRVEATQATTVFVRRRGDEMLAVDVVAGTYALLLAYQDRALLSCLVVPLARARQPFTPPEVRPLTSWRCAT